MKVTVVYQVRKGITPRGGKGKPSVRHENKEAEFTGTNAMAQAAEFVYNMQPINVVAVRKEID